MTTHSEPPLTCVPSTDNSGRFTYLITGTGTTVTVSQNQTTQTIGGLQSGKTYIIRVFIDDQPVASLNSTTGMFTCAAVRVPTYCLPIDQETTYTFTVRARDVDGNYSPLTWARPHDHSHRGRHRGQRVGAGLDLRGLLRLTSPRKP